MAVSRYIELSERIGDLHFRFVPELDPTGTYSDKDYDRMRAFRLLCHAEIENFLERVAEDGINRVQPKLQAWRLMGQSSPLVFHVARFAVSEVANVIAKNHGLKRKNVERLFAAFGMTAGSFDGVWLSTMESYGTVRGGFAHSTQWSTQMLDPQTELSLVYTQLLPHLERLEIAVAALN